MPYRNEKEKGEELSSHASYLPWYSPERDSFSSKIPATMMEVSVTI